MDGKKPAAGGVVWTLRIVSVLQFVVVLVSLTGFSLDNVAVFQAILTSAIVAVFLWALASGLLVLRRIEANSRR